MLPAPVFSVHSERSRAATWHDEEEDIVWLLAVASAHDYDYIVALGERGRLMPTVEDYEQFELLNAVAPAFVDVLQADVSTVIRRVAAQRDEVVEATVANRIRVRACWESESPDFLTVAVSKRVVPGDIELPAEWMLQLAAAFFPGVSFDEFPPFPITFVRDDELTLRHWAPAL